ncbi:type VI secretion system lipoprotein TssJ [Castellaniella sp.]|uniref:type VI secretion system lipoprotein TssJ n=1 Tax=Castellaniella sp. TaxID=1955812 RepID=UPI002AFE287C|nr:type VI secretion system lipoprotein TssJ [Castellaniella sp.]
MPPTRLLSLFVLICLASLAGGCSSVNSALGGNTSKEAKAEVAWDYARGAIQIELDSDANLNDYFNRPHTVVLGVFQVADDKTFTSALKDTDKLKQVLASGNADKDILQLDRYVVSPDKHTILTLDRVQDARFVGLIVGYYHFSPDDAAKLFRIPLNMDSSGMISTTYTAQPAHLALKLQLGRQRITNAQSLTFDADAKPNIESVPLDNKNLEIDTSSQARDAAEASSSAARKLRN